MRLDTIISNDLQFTVSAIPKTIEYANNHQDKIFEKIANLPLNWSFDDKVLGWLEPSFFPDIEACISFDGKCLTELFEIHQLNTIDNSMYKRLITKLSGDSIMSNNLQDIIRDIANKSSNTMNAYSETTTRQTIINRILYALGWNIHDNEEVVLEYSINNRRVDYSLKVNDKDEVFIEAKKVSEDLNKIQHKDQLINYAYLQGVELAVLTNGILWWFYLPITPVHFEQRRFHVIDIKNQEINDIVDKLIELLHIENVKSGEAVKSARNLLNNKLNSRIIADKMPTVWNNFLSEPSIELVSLFRNKFYETTKTDASDQQVINFIKTSITGISTKINNIPAQVHRIIEQPEFVHNLMVPNKPSPRTRLNNSMPPDGTECKMTQIRKGITTEGVIKNGLIYVEGHGEFTSLSAAASKITGNSRDGWREWKIRLPNSTDWQVAGTWRKSR